MPVLASPPYGFEQPNGWSVVLGDIMVAGGDVEAIGFPGHSEYCALPTQLGCLTLPPDGLGMPDLRTQDIDYLGSDGTQHHEDWYDPRIITLQVSIGPGSCGCDANVSVRRAARTLIQQWSRVCGKELELVIYPPNCLCDDTVNNTDDMDRPLGVTGRPRQASISYTRNGTADLVLRFDSENHLMYLLDCCGTPGSNTQCVTLTPSISSKCRRYPRCYTTLCEVGQPPGWTYNVENSVVGGPATFTGGGTECVGPTVTLYGPLSNPTVEAVTTGQKITYNGTVGAESSVVIDLSNGTASEDGVDRTGKLTGDLVMLVQPDANTWRLDAFDLNDTGYADVCWRPAVIVA